MSGTARAVVETVSESRARWHHNDIYGEGGARCVQPWMAIDHDLVGGYRPPTKWPNTRPTQLGPVHDTGHGHNHRTLSKHPDGVQCRSAIWVRCMVACRAPIWVTCIGPHPITEASNALALPTPGARLL